MAAIRMLLVMLSLAGLASCGSDDDASGVDAGGGDEADAAGEPDCFTNPTTHHEIVNACTDAQRIEKNPVLPLLNRDGSLPTLPR